MYKEVYRYFDEVLADFNVTGAALEIGATASGDTLLACPALKGASSRIGLNLDPSQAGERKEEGEAGCTIVTGNSNRMPDFADGSFQAVLSNATLEHDRHFWLSIAEMRRVLAPGGLMMIGVPGFVRDNPNAPYPLATITHRVHEWPGDYYRFSEQACLEVFFEGFEKVRQKVLRPRSPKVVTSGVKPLSDNS